MAMEGHKMNEGTVSICSSTQRNVFKSFMMTLFVLDPYSSVLYQWFSPLPTTIRAVGRFAAGRLAGEGRKLRD